MGNWDNMLLKLKKICNISQLYVVYFCVYLTNSSCCYQLYMTANIIILTFYYEQY